MVARFRDDDDDDKWNTRKQLLLPVFAPPCYVFFVLSHTYSIQQYICDVSRVTGNTHMHIRCEVISFFKSFEVFLFPLLPSCPRDPILNKHIIFLYIVRKLPLLRFVFTLTNLNVWVRIIWSFMYVDCCMVYASGVTFCFFCCWSSRLAFACLLAYYWLSQINYPKSSHDDWLLSKTGS